MRRILLALASLSIAATASPLQLSFDVHVHTAIDQLTLLSPPGFQPLDIRVQVLFDPKEERRTDIGDVKQIWFGAPVITTPFTASLPWLPGRQIAVDYPTTYVSQVGNDPNRRWGLAFREQARVIAGQQYNYSYESVIGAPDRPAFAEYDTFGTAGLRNWLEDLRLSGTPLSFSEGTYISEIGANTGSIGGLFYGGRAILTSIEEVPEPGTAVVLAAALALFTLVRARNGL